MELDAVADELYGLRPGEFTAARDRRAKEARAAGDRDLAERIHRLRRPTTAAWAGNLLVREQHEEVEALLRLGESLRQAHQELDGEQLRQLSAEQLRVISALGRQAQQLAADAGQRIGESARREVEQTLHAALAGPGGGTGVGQGPAHRVAGRPGRLPGAVRAAAGSGSPEDTRTGHGRPGPRGGAGGTRPRRRTGRRPPRGRRGRGPPADGPRADR